MKSETSTGYKAPRRTYHVARQNRQDKAKIRRVARDALSTAEQILILENRDAGHCREAVRLMAEIDGRVPSRRHRNKK